MKSMHELFKPQNISIVQWTTFNHLKFFRMRFVICIFFLITSSLFLFAQEKTFVKEYTYKASENDSKVSCRAIAINQLRSMLLDELGVYVESNHLLKTDDAGGKNSQDFVENISTISAGITKLNVLDETWNGETFWMKAAITVDTTSLSASLKQLSEDRQKVKELEDLKQRLDNANQKLAQLSQELSTQKEITARAALAEKYKSKVNEISATNLMYSAKSKFESKDYANAILDFDKIIDLDPGYALAYAYRGHAKASLQNYSEAINDFSKAIELNPKFDAAYLDRGRAKFFSSNYAGSIDDFSQAIAINPHFAPAYGSRGEAKLKLKKYREALDDFNKAIQYNAKYALAYLSRGIVNNSIGNARNACADWNRAGELGASEAFDLLRKYCR